MKKTILFFICCFNLIFGSVFADEVNVAVASNFSSTLKKLSLDFNKKTGHKLRVSAASTGKLYAQIKHGAPFDVFLAADEIRPDLLLSENVALASSAYIYAKGKLVLLSNIPPTDTCQNVLNSNSLKRLSIANPKTAPYGFAAVQVMKELSLWSKLKPRLVMGENIAQALQFVSTKNAEAGFVAKSMLVMKEVTKDACVWDVPADMYSPINQKMVVLNKAKNKVSVQAFQQYMMSVRAKKIIKSSGYDVTF